MLKNTRVVILLGVILAVLGVLLLTQEDVRIWGVVLIVIAVLGTAGLVYTNREEQDDFLEAPDEPQERPTRPSASTTTAEPLATWSAEPLATWSPPEEAGEATVAEDDTFGDSALEELEALEDLDPIAEVERLEEEAGDLETLEPYEAEFESVEVEEDVEEVEEGDLLAPIDEDVESADDIMKASAATELKGPVAGENSELAKLLAKVQSRLAAYE